MSKRFYILLGTAVLVCSLAAGVLTYQVAQESIEKRAVVDAMSWYQSLDNEFEWISPADLDGEYYEAQKKDGSSVLIDHSGKILVQAPKGASFGESSGRIIAFQDNESEKYGYMDVNGKIIAPAKFKEADAFDDGYALVSLGESEISSIDRMAPIDVRGKILNNTLEKPDQERYGYLHQIAGKYFFYDLSVIKSRIIDVEKGRVLMETERYNAVEQVGENLYAATVQTDDYGSCRTLLGGDFEPLSDDWYFNIISKFHEGMAYASALKEDDETENGYIGKDGKLLLKTGNSLYGCRFAEGKALVYEKDRVYAMDRSGRKLFELALEDSMNEDEFLDYDLDESHMIDSCWFRNGKAVLFDGKKYGIVDEKGNWVIKPLFDDMEFMGEDAVFISYKQRNGILKLR